MITSNLSVLATATGPHLFWITSRAAGIAALILSSVSVCIGLLMGGRLVKRRGVDMRVTHEALSLATLVALVVHGLTLIGDSFLHPSLADISVPFLSGYKTAWTSMGIIAFWGLALLGLSYYARAKIGVQRWRKLHRLTALAWVLGLAHSLGEGTDAGQTWFLATTAIVVAPPLTLLLARLLRGPATRPGAPTSATPPRSGFSQLPTR
ncbi:MAG TPA: ferric reductase-like transmembrane domain-containing protein [Solirubrobacteraceae bacterium]|jgi:sulfoxide reductase heme-binding subunit YedZ|nr:ferric reductase-like transmembrane domain-containing protein [Solirubrobacteraceae bacterium]